VEESKLFPPELQFSLYCWEQSDALFFKMKLFSPQGGHGLVSAASMFDPHDRPCSYFQRLLIPLPIRHDSSKSFQSQSGGFLMKALFGVGLVIVVLGILSFFVPIPHTEHHGVSAGDLHVGVNTEHSDRVSPAISVVLLVAGAGMMIAGRGKNV
jgi:hypothetical protein